MDLSIDESKFDGLMSEAWVQSSALFGWPFRELTYELISPPQLWRWFIWLSPSKKGKIMLVSWRVPFWCLLFEMTSNPEATPLPYESAQLPAAPKKKAKLEESLVRLNGKKLRAGTIPWRFVSDTEIEIFLIEGLNTPGFWSFPAGSLDPGEEVSCCASRETYEECGAIGSLGCFLGVFLEEKNRTYLFSMQVHRVENEGADIWNDLHSSCEGSGERRRKWFTPANARSVLKKIGPAMLDTFLTVPAHQLVQRMPKRLRRSQLPIFIVGATDALLQHCMQQGEILDGTVALQSSDYTERQKFAIIAATLWEADAAICIGGPEISYVAALACTSGCPTLLLETSEAMPWLLQGDSRVTRHFVGEGLPWLQFIY